MNEPIFLLGYFVLLASVIVGIVRYKYYDKATRIILLLLSISLLSEIASYAAVRLEAIDLKDVIYHCYSIVEIVLVTLFFLEAIKPYRYRKLKLLAIFLWPVMGILNVILLQPLRKLNTNMLMLESFSIITMSLYLIYWLLKKNSNENIVKNPHFQMAVVWLVYWSGTFFFWAFIKILYGDRWPYIHTAITLQSMLLLVTYLGFLLIFLFYPKNTRTIESN